MTMAARVAYVLKMFPRFSETFVLSELLELERQGAELHVFSLRRPDDGIFHRDVSRLRAPVTYVPESPAPTPHKKHRLQAKAIAPHLRREGIRHVHAHFASGATSVAMHLHRLAGVSYSFTAHAKDIYLDTVSETDLARKLRRARFAVTVSDFNRRHLSRLDGGAGHLVRIYNGLDLHQFSRNGTGPDDPPLVLAVGRLIEKKGFGDLVRACAVLRAEGCRFGCLIVGKGALEPELKALIRSLGLQREVDLAGPLPREALLELYPRASVVAAPCVVGSDGNRDGLPTVLTEAMALGVPVVSTDVTGIPELVEHGRTGLVVPQRDPEVLAAAIRRTLADPASARALAQAGRERVEQDFDLRRNVGGLRRLFEEACSA
jgi:colanic acid/amylovoran biosynthesis glycosyltransferase